MAVLTQNRNTEWKPFDTIEVPMAIDIIFKGGGVCFNAAGFATPAADTAGNVTLGIALEKQDNSGGAAGDLTVAVQVGGTARLVGVGGAQTDVGATLFWVDDQTVQAAATVNNIPAGICVRFNAATDLEFEVATPADTL